MTAIIAWVKAGGFKILGIASLVILVAFLVIALGNSRDRVETLSEKLREAQGQVVLLTKARELDEQLLSENAAEKEAAQKAAKVIQDEIDEAAEANPDWASQPIPVAVTDSLRRAAEAASGKADSGTP